MTHASLSRSNANGHPRTGKRCVGMALVLGVVLAFSQTARAASADDWAPTQYGSHETHADAPWLFAIGPDEEGKEPVSDIILVADVEHTGQPVDLLLGEHATFLPIGDKNVLRVKPMLTIPMGFLYEGGGFHRYPIESVPETFRADGYFYCQAVIRGTERDIYSTGLFLSKRRPVHADDVSTFHPSHVHYPGPSGVAGWLGEGDFVGALSAALNSVGDEIKFNVKLGGSIGFGINASGDGVYEVRLQRIEDDDGHEVYEMLVGVEIGAYAGFEVYEETEGKFGVKEGADLVFRFDNADDAAKGLASVFATTTLADRWGPNLSEVLANREQWRKQLEGTVKWLSGKLANARWWARPGIAAARSKMQKLLNLARSIEAQLRQALTSATDARAFLYEHGDGFQFHFTYPYVEIEAKLAIPGLNIAGFPQVHAALNAGFTGTLRYRDLTPDHPVIKVAGVSDAHYFQLIIQTKTEVELKYGAGVVAGWEDDWKVYKSMRFVLERRYPDPEVKLVEVDSNLNYEFLRSGEAALVVGVNAGYGRTITGALPGDDAVSNFKSRMETLWSLVRDVAQGNPLPPWSEIPEAFQHERPFSVQDSIRGGALFKIGASIAGTGLTLEGSATWIDQGPKHEEELMVLEGYLRIKMEASIENQLSAGDWSLLEEVDEVEAHYQ